jgi:hypothetical protein
LAESLSVHDNFWQTQSPVYTDTELFSAEQAGIFTLDLAICRWGRYDERYAAGRQKSSLQGGILSETAKQEM